MNNKKQKKTNDNEIEVNFIHIQSNNVDKNKIEK